MSPEERSTLLTTPKSFYTTTKQEKKTVDINIL